MLSDEPPETSAPFTPAHGDRIVILGSGCFGISAAHHLLKRGYTNVTVLERSPFLPAPDASSVDINRICRSDYEDPLYAKLAKDAIDEWRKPDWQGMYHETGLLCTSEPCQNATDTHHNVKALGLRNRMIATISDLESLWPKQHIYPRLRTGNYTYINQEAGWVESGNTLKLMIEWCRDMGAKILSDQVFNKFEIKNGQVRGVVTQNKTYPADVVILATGAWTESILADTPLSLKPGTVTASGQCVVTFRLDEAKRKEYEHLPVVMDFDSGFYIFPPNATGDVKMAMHLPGYLSGDSISTPKTCGLLPAEATPIPKAALRQVQLELAKLYPELATMAPSWTRMCWYADSSNSDFIIARDRTYSNVLFATAGSGHGYKFMPIIGQYVADLVEGKLDARLAQKWGWDGRSDHLGGGCRQGQRLNLSEAE